MPAPRSDRPSSAPPTAEVACPRCEQTTVVAVDGYDSAWSCPSCAWTAKLDASPPAGDAALESCWICGADEFYIQKDFNRELGLSIVLASAGIVFLVMLIYGHRVGVVLLLAIAAIDWIVYRLLANVTVCYLCHTIYRRFPLGETHRGFYLGTEEKYKKIRRRWLEESSAADASPSVPLSSGGEG